MTGAIFGRASTIAKERKKKDVSRNPERDCTFHDLN